MKLSQYERTNICFLLASFLLWTYGCTSTTLVRNVRDSSALISKEITVNTRDGRNYLLTTWSSDKAKNIIGKGAQVLPSEQFGVTYKAFSGMLLADSIATLEQTEIDGGKTALFILGCVVVVGFIDLAVWSHSNDPVPIWTKAP